MLNWDDKNIQENNLQVFLINLKKAWEKSIGWGLQNWKKFQFIQLLESSILAEQFSINDNKELQALYSQLVEITELGVKYGYFKNLPTIYLVDLTRSIIASTTKFLNNNNYDSDNSEVMESLWRVYCDMMIA